MRSVVKLLAYILLAVLVPSLVMGAVSFFGASNIIVIISQFVIMLIMVFAFTKSFDYMRRYEKKTMDMMGRAKSVEELRKLREERLSYKSKAMITNEILNREFSEEEAEILKKYTNSTEDMKHYYSALISNSSGKKREELKIRRDNFKKKYGNKARIYPDFRENLKTCGKWIGLFFLLAIFFASIKSRAFGNPGLAMFIYIIQIIMLASFMINAITWLIRCVISFWDRKFI